MKRIGGGKGIFVDTVHVFRSGVVGHEPIVGLYAHLLSPRGYEYPGGDQGRDFLLRDAVGVHVSSREVYLEALGVEESESLRAVYGGCGVRAGLRMFRAILDDKPIIQDGVVLQLLGVILDDPCALWGVVHRLETGLGDRHDKLALGVGDAPGEDELGLSVDGGARGSEAGEPLLLHRGL